MAMETIEEIRDDMTAVMMMVLSGTGAAGGGTGVAGAVVVGVGSGVVGPVVVGVVAGSVVAGVVGSFGAWSRSLRRDPFPRLFWWSLISCEPR